MENIFELNKPFDFSKLSLAHPSAIQGGSYFTKIEHGLKPLYIQTTKSQTKQGISKSGKKYYCAHSGQVLGPHSGLVWVFWGLV